MKIQFKKVQISDSKTRSVRRSGNRSRRPHHHLHHHRRPLPPPTAPAAAAATSAADPTATADATAATNGVDIALWVIYQDKDMLGGIEVEMGVLWDCWGEWGLKGTRDDIATPYSVKYL